MLTEKQLRQLQKQGKIKGYQVHRRIKERTNANRLPAAPNKAKEWLSLNLQLWANEQCLELVTEHRFHPDRKWRFDWALPAVKVAVEYEGIHSAKSRHTTKKGYAGDVEKYNAATADGWRIIRATSSDYKNVLKLLNDMITTAGNPPIWGIA